MILSNASQSPADIILLLTFILVSRHERAYHAAVVIDGEEDIILVGGGCWRSTGQMAETTGEMVKSKLVE